MCAAVSRRTRIVLADEQPIVLNGLRNLIMTEGDLELVGEATSGPAALAIIRETRPDVAVRWTFSLSGLNGIVLTRRLSTETPSVGVLVLTCTRSRLRQTGLQKQAPRLRTQEIGGRHLVVAVRAVAVGISMLIQ